MDCIRIDPADLKIEDRIIGEYDWVSGKIQSVNKKEDIKGEKWFTLEEIIDNFEEMLKFSGDIINRVPDRSIMEKDEPTATVHGIAEVKSNQTAWIKRLLIVLILVTVFITLSVLIFGCYAMKIRKENANYYN